MTLMTLMIIRGWRRSGSVRLHTVKSPPDDIERLTLSPLRE
jgi:hypothetical protein